MKPRIKLLRHNNPTRWVCAGGGWSALGGSPREAYDRWNSLVMLAREARLAEARAQAMVLAEARSARISRV